MAVRRPTLEQLRSVAEDLGLDPVGLEDGGDQVGLQALAPKYHFPAFDSHQSHPRDGSTVAGWSAPA